MSSKNKHMTLQDRIEIQECLSKGMTFKAIGKRIGKDQTTISKEVKLHAQEHRNGFVKTDQTCPKLLKAPYVCNGCPLKSNAGCKFLRRLYVAKTAQTEYAELLVDARTGTPLNKEEFYQAERLVSAAVINGQHVFHAIKSNNLPVSVASVYRYIKRGYYTISPLDLPRAVKFKPRKQKHPEYVPQGVKKGRSFEDFLKYSELCPELPLVEMDTVIGNPGGKTIMTIHFVNADFMFGILLENKTAAEASSKIIALKEKMKIAGYSFGDIFPVILTEHMKQAVSFSANVQRLR